MPRACVVCRESSRRGFFDDEVDTFVAGGVVADSGGDLVVLIAVGGGVLDLAKG